MMTKDTLAKMDNKELIKTLDRANEATINDVNYLNNVFGNDQSAQPTMMDVMSLILQNEAIIMESNKRILETLGR